MTTTSSHDILSVFWQCYCLNEERLAYVSFMTKENVVFELDQHFKYNLCWVVMMGYRVHRVPYELLLRKALHVLSSIPRHDVYWYKEINIDTGVYLSAPV